MMNTCSKCLSEKHNSSHFGIIIREQPAGWRKSTSAGAGLSREGVRMGREGEDDDRGC